jgi:AcrR family transcriptional regulator
MDGKLLDATVTVLGESGWDGLSLERVADRAGLSRVTLWRQGVTKETLIDGLLARLADDYRGAMWPVLTASGTGRDRLRLALDALCDVADRHLQLLLISDTIFHQVPLNSLEPFVRILREGAADGTLRGSSDDGDAADVLFNTVCWSYVHLRARHRWPKSRARTAIADLVLNGATAPA